MKRIHVLEAMRLVLSLACVVCLPAKAAVIVNGGLEAGFTGWTRADQVGSEGTFALQTGTASPVTASPVPAPPQGAFAAMTDAEGPGSHVLYQDFVVSAPVTPTTLTFSLFVQNQATEFFSPDTLDFATPALNQQARVDILSVSVDPFSVAPGDVLQNLFRTVPGDPLTSGYDTLSFDITALLNAHVNQTLRLRFAEVDNVNLFQFGVDNVSFVSAAVPEPSTWLLALVALGILSAARWQKRRRESIRS
jgi:hypothetical protein